MSKSQLQIVFDREDRTYHFGEQISGRVILEALDKITCRRIWMDYGWRTHGKGNVDKGKKDILTLQSEETHFLKGEQKACSFWFTAPNGPVTYHGVNINVDWYITAHADVPLAPDIKHEEDILLLPSESPAVIIFGDTHLSQIQSPTRRRTVLPTTSASYDRQPIHAPRDPFSHIHMTQIILAIVLALGIVALLVFLKLSWHYTLAIATIAGMLIYGAMRIMSIAISKRKLDIGEIRIEPSNVYVGDQLDCYLQFQTKGEVWLDSIATLLTAEEVAVSGAGTNQTTHKHSAYQKSFVKPYAENLMPGRWITFESHLPIPPSAPSTFTATNNKVVWSLKIKVTLIHWPSWEKTMPITVLPA